MSEPQLPDESREEDRRNLEDFRRAKQRMEEVRPAQDGGSGSWAGTLAIAVIVVILGAIFLIPQRGHVDGATRSSKLEREQRLLLIEQAERAAQDSSRSEGQPHVELTASEQP